MTDLAAIKAELRTLLEKATPGPWTLCPDLGGCECGHGTQSIDARAGEVVIAEFRDLTDPPNESESNNTEPVETRRANAALIVALRNHAEALLADAPSVEPAGHQPGDHHDYRIECSTCGQRGQVTLSVEPQRTDEPWKCHVCGGLGAHTATEGDHEGIPPHSFRPGGAPLPTQASDSPEKTP